MYTKWGLDAAVECCPMVDDGLALGGVLITIFLSERSGHKSVLLATLGTYYVLARAGIKP
jgi:hypothetical protein